MEVFSSLELPFCKLHRSAIEQEATELLRTYPLSDDGFGEVVNHKICC